VPRQIADDDEMPRRRRRAKAVAVEASEERGLVMRMLLHSPKDIVAGALAAAAVVAIITNALFLQAGRHPSPMFGSVITLPPPAPNVAAASPLPRPRPVEAAARPAEPATAEPRSIELKSAEAKPVEAKSSDPMTSLVVKSTSAVPTSSANVARPPAPIPLATQSPAAKRIAAVQRALTEYGYGQLKPTGTIGSDSQAAISKFERDRKLPVTGQMSDRMVRELSAMIGHPID
jgi:Putative peptidoglycan binding domain